MYSSRRLWGFHCSKIIAPLLVLGGWALLIQLIACRQPTVAESLLIGEWECQSEPNNAYRMHVEWDRVEKKFKGVLTRQGNGSQTVGFKLGEVCWKASPAGASNLLEEEQEYRWGSGGVSSGSQWRKAKLDLSVCTKEKLVSPMHSFKRVK